MLCRKKVRETISLAKSKHVLIQVAGVNRAERGGKDDSGSYIGTAGSYASSAGGAVMGGAKSAGSYVGSMFGGKKEESA